MREELSLCLRLLHGDELLTSRSDGIIPIDLADGYGKVLAARELGKSLNSAAGQAALCRSAFAANEDDRVRIECVQQLLNNHSPLLETVLFGLLFDDDELMRLTAIEGLALSRSHEIAIAAAIVARDESIRVRELMERVLNGDAIDLFHLDPPTID
ncbi:hypothetical protein [Aeoliella sp. SH292]|uniref:hypothetical protein n=1 Tax=Aeoliella sp. SH292 TaxID=3454464 RepID=UPI003F9586F3